MKENIAGRGDGVARTGANLAKRMKLGGSRVAEQPVPDDGPETDDARQVSGGLAKAHGANQRRQIRAYRPYGDEAFVAGFRGEGEKDGVSRERHDHRLRRNG
jgi:hypothetical protein